MSLPAINLMSGRTVHARETPFQRRFSYALALIEIDIDRLDEADRQAGLFSIDRFNAIAFHRRDHGVRADGMPLRPWAQERFAEAGVKLDGGAIRLVAFPRVLGIGFSPISLWLGHGPAGDLRGVIYEVHNTFGETHCYVARFEADVRTEAAKDFHVSPFFDVDGGYRFTLREPGADPDGKLELIVENMGPDGRRHVASLLLRRGKFTSAAAFRWLVTMPFSGVGTILAIHWQALVLWIKGAGYRDKPAHRAHRTTVASPEQAEIPCVEQMEDGRKRA